MTDERDRRSEENHHNEDDGLPMSHEEWLRYLEEKRKDHRVIGSGTYEDPYRLPGTEPHQ